MGTIHVLPADQIEDLLRTALVGRIACCAPAIDPRPYLVPLAYGYDGEAVYAHSGPGRKIHLMRANPLVTFEVDTAAADDRWQSVIAEGHYQEITAPADRAAALLTIYPPPHTPPALPPDTVVYRLLLTSKSGRYEVP